MDKLPIYYIGCRMRKIIMDAATTIVASDDSSTLYSFDSQ